MIFQHVANEILGTLNPLLKESKFRVRYINFERDPNAHPTVEKYGGLVVLGGNMGVYEADKYTHIKVEMQLIEKALKKGVPILGICLGSQLLAHVLGSSVRKHTEKEIGWCDVELTTAGRSDSLFSHFDKTEKVFQMHGDTFDVPASCEHLAFSSRCAGQAFRYGEKVYGLQFHLEVDEAMILRWLRNPAHQRDMSGDGGMTEERLLADTSSHLGRSLELSRELFRKFIALFGLKKRGVLLGSEHGKPKKPG